MYNILYFDTLIQAQSHMAMSGNPKDRMDDFPDASDVSSDVEKKRGYENGGDHKEEIPDSIWEDTMNLIDETQQLIDKGRKACKREISILKGMIERKKTKEQLEEDKKRLSRN
jgi:hypothetical protein